jgi:hypothetical protein
MTGKQRNQMIMIGVLVVVLIAVLLNSLRTVRKKKAEAEAARQKALAAQSAAAPAATAPAAASGTTAPAAAAAPSASAPAAVLPPVEEAKPEDIKKQKEIAEGEWGSDPFYRGVAGGASAQKGAAGDGASGQDATQQQAVYALPPAAESSLVLSGITRAGESFIAVINRKVVRTGDTVSQDTLSYTVKDIQKDKVIVEMNGGSYELKLRK